MKKTRVLLSEENLWWQASLPAVEPGILPGGFDVRTKRDGQILAVTMQSGKTFALPTNRKVGLGVLTPPPGMLDTLDGRGGVRTPSPTCLWRFRGSRREKCFRRILTLTHSPRRGNHQWPRREKLPAVESSSTLKKFFPHSGGEGQGEGKHEFQLNSFVFEPSIRRQDADLYGRQDARRYVNAYEKDPRPAH